jgi:hypothetical protein
MAETNWTLIGNAGINPSSNFLGTTDDRPLVLKTLGREALRINSLGSVGIGTNNPGATLHVSTGNGFAVPQVRIAQTTPYDFARLQFVSYGADVDRPAVPLPYPLWDIAAGRGVLNFFRQDTGNVMTLVGGLGPRVGIGTETPQTTLEVNGMATVGILQITGGADVAEPFCVDDVDLDPGTVVVIDDDQPGKLKVSDTAYDCKVAGIVSGAGGYQPGLTLQQGQISDGTVCVAMAGRVYCKAEAVSAPIRPGDLLTTSDLSGHAMKAADRWRSHGAIIGKAMSALQEGTGLILVLANLH